MPLDRRPGATVRLGVHAVALFLAACTGTIENPGAGSADAGGPPGDTPSSGGRPGPGSGGRSSAGGVSAPSGGAPVGSGGTNAGAGDSGGPVGMAGSVCDGAPVDPGAAPLRLLSRVQYVNTMKALFGSLPEIEAAAAGNVSASAIGAGQGDVSQVELEEYQRAAESIATAAVSGDRLDLLVPCASGADRRACVREFVTAFGARAYRAPLTEADDVERHVALYDAGAEVDHRHGVELLLRGMLQSSRFLYRVELGTGERVGDAAVALSGYETAARLAYAFWEGPPDERLTEAAASGALADEAGVARELSRMLEDARGKAAVRRFLGALMHLDGVELAVKDATLFPEWQVPSFRASLRSQSERFFDDVLQNGARLETLLTSNRVFVNRELAPYYGVSAGNDFVRIEVARERAAGLLTLPAFLALTSKPNESSPIYRGKFVREALLCQPPPPPPPDIPKPPTVEAGVSTRERLAQHEADPACSGCHRLLDPIGFGFEHYDAIGRYRETDGGKPVDARGELVGTSNLDGPFDGVAELGQRLSASAEVRRCIARQWFRYVLSRYEEGADSCSVERVTAAFESSAGDLNRLPRAIVATHAFRYRRAIAAATP